MPKVRKTKITIDNWGKSNRMLGPNNDHYYEPDEIYLDSASKIATRLCRLFPITDGMNLENIRVSFKREDAWEGKPQKIIITLDLNLKIKANGFVWETGFTVALTSSGNNLSFEVRNKENGADGWSDDLSNGNAPGCFLSHEEIARAVAKPILYILQSQLTKLSRQRAELESKLEKALEFLE